MNIEKFQNQVKKLHSLLETIEKRGIFSPLSIELMYEVEIILNGFNKVMWKLKKISIDNKKISEMILFIENVMPFLEDIQYLEKIKRKIINEM